MDFLIPSMVGGRCYLRFHESPSAVPYCPTWTVVYLDSCPTWTVVQHGQLSYLHSCVPGQLSPGQLSTWTVVTWTVFVASFSPSALVRSYSIMASDSFCPFVPAFSLCHSHSCCLFVVSCPLPSSSFRLPVSSGVFLLARHFLIGYPPYDDSRIPQRFPSPLSVLYLPF